MGSRPGQINISAVCKVLAAHLWDCGERPDTDTALARKLKDRTQRALTGAGLSAETLGWFVGAFDLPPVDARRLEALLTGSPDLRVLTGAASTTLPIATKHRTLSLHEHHYLGADGSPVLHRTTQILEAIADGLDSYLYMFDTNAVTVEVMHGGRVHGPLVTVGEGIYGLTIRLTRALAAGETTTIEYRTTFEYRALPQPEFRRATFRHVDSVDIRVQFHPGRLPAAVQYAEWPALESAPHLLRPAQLEADGSVHVFLRSVEKVIVGFTWQWPDAGRLDV